MVTICHGCPYYRIEFGIAMEFDGRQVRIDDICLAGVIGAGDRMACDSRPAKVDTGERVRLTDNKD